MKRGPLVLLGAAALVVAGALALGRREVVPPGTRPPEVRIGVDPCDRCLMIVSELRFAAAYETRAGEVRRFDDVADLLAFRREQDVASREDVAAYWVQDLEGEGWVRAEAASFVHAPDFVTPMGSGLVAFEDAERAAAFAAAQRGQRRSFSELLGDAASADAPGAP